MTIGDYRFESFRLVDGATGSSGVSKYIPQMQAIAREWGEHFSPLVVDEAIPHDAVRGDCYLCISGEDRVLAFLIGMPSYTEAEALWGATDGSIAKGKSDIFKKLFEKLESDYFAFGAQYISVKVPTESSVCPGTDVKGEHWDRTYAFYRKIGYFRSYTLPNYWAPGNHAYVLRKSNPKNEHPVAGYDHFSLGPIRAGEGGVPSRRQDIFKEINITLFKEIYSYLFQYKLGVAELSRKGFAGEGLGNVLSGMGFVGVGFFPAQSSVASIFCSAMTDEPTLDKYVPRHEYEIQDSALTRILSDESLGDYAIVRYPSAWDDNSEIRLKDFFSAYIPSMSGEFNYSIFMHRSTRSHDGSFFVFYIIVRSLNDSLVYGQRWQWLLVSSSYSMLLAASLRNVIVAIRERLYSEAGHASHEYLGSLLSCLNMPEGWAEAFKNLAKKADDIVLDDTYSAMDAALAHDMKNVISHTIIKPLHDLEDALDAVPRAQGSEAALKKIRTALGRSVRSCEQYRSTLMRFLEGFRAIELGRSECGGGGGWTWTRGALASFVRKLLSNGAELRVEGDDDLQVGMPVEALEVLLQFIVSNIVDAFDAAAGKLGGRKLQIEIRAENLRGLGEDGAVMDRFRFSIWNSGTQFPEHVLLSGGARPSTKYIKQNHSGMGLYFVERILRKANAIEFDCHDVRRHFCIENTDDPRGARLCFEVPVSTI